LLSVYSNIYGNTEKHPEPLNVITVEPGAAAGVVTATLPLEINPAGTEIFG
jgi:hypothetical protein